MANSITIQIRGDTAANWTSKNPVPKDRELCYDKTNNQLKTGDGSTAWNSLKYTPEIINGLTSTSANAALSAAQGKALADRVTTLENKPAGSTVSLINNHTTTTSGTGALDAYQGKVIYDAAVKAATTSNAGQVQLSDSTSGTSTTKAATENAVKKAYDLANSANSKIPSGTILTSSNYSNYISTTSQGILNAESRYYYYENNEKTINVPSGGTWYIFIFAQATRNFILNNNSGISLFDIYFTKASGGEKVDLTPYYGSNSKYISTIALRVK